MMTITEILINKKIDQLNAQIAENNSYIIDCKESIVTHENQIKDCNDGITQLINDLEKLK